MSLKRAILYYPTISIPSRSWLRRTILYWDEIGSIVPQSYDNRSLVPYSADIKFLQSEGIFRPFRPDAIFRQDWEMVQKFEEEFKSLLESPKFRVRQSPIVSMSRVHRGKVPMPYEIHKDKVSENLFQYLETRKLAFEDPKDDDWYVFEKTTAFVYMSVLAKYLANGDMQSVTIPGTDRRIYRDFILQAKGRDDGFTSLVAVLSNILPLPRGDVSLIRLLEFKERRRLELLTFRQLLDDFQRDLRGCESELEVNEVAVAFSEKLERGIKEIEAVLQDAKIATFVGSFETVISLESPALWTAVGAQVANLPLVWKIFGVLGAGAIKIRKYPVDRRNEQNANLRESPFSYLYYAEREGIVS